MANNVVSTIGAFISAALALLWIITLTVPWDWLWSQNAINIFHVNLFSVYLDKGLGGYILTGLTSLVSESAASGLNDMLRQSLWMETAVQQLCMPGIDTVWRWCDTWMMVKVGSLLMVLLGFVLVGLLISGGACLYYYANYQATQSGRMAALGCFVGAPVCAVLGLLQYIILTFQMGSGERQFIDTEASYGPGFFFACTLTIFTFVPLYIQVTFNKADLFEKVGDEEEVDTGVVYAPGYGATSPAYIPAAPAYTAPPPSGFGGAPVYQTPPPGPGGNFGLPPAQGVLGSAGPPPMAPGPMSMGPPTGPGPVPPMGMGPAPGSAW